MRVSFRNSVVHDPTLAVRLVLHHESSGVGTCPPTGHDPLQGGRTSECHGEEEWTRVGTGEAPRTPRSRRHNSPGLRLLSLRTLSWVSVSFPPLDTA